MTRLAKRMICAGVSLIFFGTTALASAQSKTPAKVPSPASAMPSTAPVAQSSWAFSLKPESSIFAVVTQKAGVAARLAHDHFITAKTFEATLAADPLQLNKGSFSFKTQVNELEVDQPELQKKWFPIIQSLGWLKDPFTALKPSDRNTIRENMLAKDQLNAAAYPEIKAEVQSITDVQSSIGEKNFRKKAQVAVTICGKTIARQMSVNLNLQGQELEIEAAGEFKFTEFGIKPYKALLGALGNDDQFFMFVSFKAVKK